MFRYEKDLGFVLTLLYFFFFFFLSFSFLWIARSRRFYVTKFYKVLPASMYFEILCSPNFIRTAIDSGFIICRFQMCVRNETKMNLITYQASSRKFQMIIKYQVAGTQATVNIQKSDPIKYQCLAKHFSNNNFLF